ncbi:Protein-glutamate O-methyltransferase [Acanthopleuribacter pedis]|uniref:protein-glutamate O-methyltransferase n=2 Tax=Acanthopleuribacter pedis TaxID=442870 RepID=A0A8J7U1X0_9BACT|nr:protein-glutamate O-methyltransferase CheR [Acanthopleuribacter pedis]
MVHHSGVLIPAEKSYLFQNRLRPLLRRYHCDSFETLYERAQAPDATDLVGAVIEAMTTHETSFFRDPWAFEALTEELERLYRLGKREVSIWSAACSTGEEPYSIAMVVYEFCRKRPSMKCTILASDIADDTLAKARKAEYFRLGSYLPEDYAGRFFLRADRRMTLREEIRGMVDFEHFNLLDIRKRGKVFDIIFCRNVALYFPNDIRLPFFQDLANCLPAGGMLLVGSSESMYRATARYERARHGNHFYYRRAR